MKISAVLFDMDGTLTDTERHHCQYWPQAFHEFGYTDFTYEDGLHNRSFNSRDAERYWKARYGEDLDYDGIHRRERQLMDRWASENEIPLKPGIHETLSYLKSRGYKTAVVTATDYDRASTRLKKLGIFDIFDTVISAHDVPNGKPHPDCYLYACRELGFPACECIAVEDSPNGVKSASRAGCHVVMVPDLTQPDDDLRKMLDAVCADLTGIIDLLK